MAFYHSFARHARCGGCVVAGPGAGGGTRAGAGAVEGRHGGKEGAVLFFDDTCKALHAKRV